MIASKKQYAICIIAVLLLTILYSLFFAYKLTDKMGTEADDLSKYVSINYDKKAEYDFTDYIENNQEGIEIDQDIDREFDVLSDGLPTQVYGFTPKGYLYEQESYFGKTYFVFQYNWLNKTGDVSGDDIKTYIKNHKVLMTIRTFWLSNYIGEYLFLVVLFNVITFLVAKVMHYIVPVLATHFRFRGKEEIPVSAEGAFRYLYKKSTSGYPLLIATSIFAGGFSLQGIFTENNYALVGMASVILTAFIILYMIYFAIIEYIKISRI